VDGGDDDVAVLGFRVPPPRVDRRQRHQVRHACRSDRTSACRSIELPSGPVHRTARQSSSASGA
jgi:hypothetical protein